MTPVLAVTIFMSGVFGTIVAAMAATARSPLGDPEVPSWIATLTKWGTPRPRLPKLRDVDVSLEVELPEDYDPDCYYCEMGDPHETHMTSTEVYPSSENGYHGRHRRLELEQDRAWREHHAQWDTQGWPTLATGVKVSGELLDQRPDICVGVQEPDELPLVGWTSRPAHEAVLPTQPILALADL